MSPINPPMLGILLGTAGILFCALSLLRRAQVMRPLGYLFLVIALLNACVEVNPRLSDLMFRVLSSMLVVLFTATYSGLFVSLTKSLDVGSRWSAFNISVLPLMLFISLGIIALIVIGVPTGLENAYLAVYTFLVFTSTLHGALYAASLARNVKATGVAVKEWPTSVRAGLIQGIRGLISIAVIIIVATAISEHRNWELVSLDIVMVIVVAIGLVATNRATAEGPFQARNRSHVR